MIDNFKLFALDKHKADDHIINNEVVELQSYFNYATSTDGITWTSRNLTPMPSTYTYQNASIAV